MTFRIALCSVALVTVVGCADSVSLKVEPTVLTVNSGKSGDPVPESTLVISNTGSELLKLASFEPHVPDGYKLQWCTVDSTSGTVLGPPLIAGVIDGRELFPAVIDIQKGTSIRLMLNWLPTDKSPTDGKLIWKTNAPAKPELTIPIKVAK